VTAKILESKISLYEVDVIS